MVKRFPMRDKPKKLWRKEDGVNAWGTHDPVHFHPHRTDLPIRCFQCSNLMAADFTSEGECPNCHWRFTKADARDMYVEAVIANLNGGWDKAKLDVFSSYDYPVRMEPDGTIARIEDVERTMAAWSTKALRKSEYNMYDEEADWGPKRIAWEKKMREVYAAERAKIEHKRRTEAEQEMINYLRSQDGLGDLR